MNNKNHFRNRSTLAFAIVAGVLAITSAAFACTEFRGSISISGNGTAPAGWPAAGSSFAWGDGAHGMTYCLGGNPTGYAYAPTGATGTATVTVADHACTGTGTTRTFLTGGTYDVNFLNVGGFTNYSNRNWVRDCMSPLTSTDVNGLPVLKAVDTVNIGSMVVSSTGAGTGTYNLNAAISNRTTNPSGPVPTEEAAICVSSPVGASVSQGMEGPITLI